MSTSRFLAISFFLSTPFVITNCASEEPADDTAAGTGNSMAGTTSGTSGKGGAAGSAGSGVSGSGVSGSGTSGSSGSSSGSAGTATAGTGGRTGGTGGTTGGSTSGGAGAGGTTTAGAGAGGTTGGSAGAGGSTGGALGGAGAGGSSAGSGGSGGGTFTLTSSKLTANMSMPDDFTCAGDGHSPPLAWTGAPAGTMSFAMVFVDTTILDVDDSDTRGWHSAIWDMPATTTSLPEDLPIGATLTTPVMAKQLNPLCAGYLGPCAGHEDEYEFRLYALPVATLPGQVNSVINIGASIEAANPLGMATLHVKANATGSLNASCN